MARRAPRPSVRVPRASGFAPARAREWRRRWDLQQAAGVPGREERFGAVLDALEAALGRRFRFLDVGAGTGSLSERVLRRFPGARGVAVDFDPVLLRIGTTGLARLAGRLRWVEADIRLPDWTRHLPKGRFDAAISSTALHWLTGRELAGFYRRVAPRLRKGALFLNADSITFPADEPRLRGVARTLRHRGGEVPARAESWIAWWASVVEDPGLAAEVEVRRRRFPHEHSGTPTPDLPGHVRRLRAAGFREVGVIWSRGDNRILAAIR
jgi:SAM-dependent methyltransferase